MNLPRNDTDLALDYAVTYTVGCCRMSVNVYKVKSGQTNMSY